MFQLDILWKDSIEEENTKTEYLSEVKSTSKSEVNMKIHLFLEINMQDKFQALCHFHLSFHFFCIFLITSED